ncbi:hypothetical protein PISMIDRAFT_684404 [Pisolithus microcarpus 441]|uniref:Uncharacterized protein n=1 Tax=Pisolithus microcarpus 441 TaxID=765257 RepID=A0A0C9Z706_9AGAM|nr:hypothetical protein PISMIDRAFT_684404 [Pisolithus microcarpus 441]
MVYALLFSVDDDPHLSGFVGEGKDANLLTTSGPVIDYDDIGVGLSGIDRHDCKL